MTPEANAALHAIQADYPAVRWTHDGPDTVILYFEHIKAYVFLCSEAQPLDEARARAELDALLGVTSVTPDEALESAPEEPAPPPAPDPADPLVPPTPANDVPAPDGPAPTPPAEG